MSFDFFKSLDTTLGQNYLKLETSGETGDMSIYARNSPQYYNQTIKQYIKTSKTMQRFDKSTKCLIMATEKSWIVRIDLWNFSQITLYIIPCSSMKSSQVISNGIMII